MNKPVTPPKPHVLVEAQPFIPYVREEDFSPKLKPVLEPYKKRMGFLPNALKLYAHRPEIAETLWKLNSNIMRDPSSTLDQLLKRKLAAIACATNGCAYCTAHSCSMLKKPRGDDFEGWGVSEEELQALITGDIEPKDEFERVCFDYVRAASADPTSVPDEILQRLKKYLTPAADRRARLRRRLLEILQRRARQPAHSGGEPTSARHGLCRSLKRADKKGRGRRNTALAGEIKSTSFRLPATVSRPALLEKGSDDRFRRLVYDLLTIASRMTTVREHLGGRMGISAPQYSPADGGRPIPGRARRRRHRRRQSSACVQRLCRHRVRQARAGRVAREARQPERWPRGAVEPDARRPEFDRAQQRRIRAVNDIFFGTLTPSLFAAASAAMAALVRGSARATRIPAPPGTQVPGAKPRNSGGLASLGRKSGFRAQKKRL